jgi:hypothetical protein
MRRLGPVTHKSGRLCSMQRWHGRSSEHLSFAARHSVHAGSNIRLPLEPDERLPAVFRFVFRLWVEFESELESDAVALT